MDIFANPRPPILALSICKYKQLFNGFGVAVTSVGSNSDVRFGWTVGAGVEGKITHNWSAKLEYLYLDFDTFRAGGFTTAPAVAIGANVDAKFHDHILRVGSNRAFSGPVVAKY